MTLSRIQILESCKNDKLVVPYKEELIKTCSYDLTFSGEYQMYTSQNEGQISKLHRGEKLIIPADAICFVLTKEAVNIPLNLTAHVSLSLSLIKHGVMMAAQPPYDAGYSGKTLALLHNLSSEPVELEIGQHILNIVFEELTTKVSYEQRYNGNYNHAYDLSAFKISTKIKGGVFDLAESLRKQEKLFNNAIPNLLTIITVIIGVVTILLSVLGTASFFGGSCTGSTLQENNEAADNNNYIDNIKVIPSPTEENEIIAFFNDEIYWIDFENLLVSKCE